jgi:hypothetical protein
MGRSCGVVLFASDMIRRVFDPHPITISCRRTCFNLNNNSILSSNTAKRLILKVKTDSFFQGGVLILRRLGRLVLNVRA